MSYSLGLDASTQSISAIIIDVEVGEVVAEGSVNFGERLPHYKAPSGFIAGGEGGEVHSDPLMWLDALEILLEELSGKFDLSKVSAVSGAGQQHGSVYLNEKWLAGVRNFDSNRSLSEQVKPLLARKTSPIWMDSSTSAECREIAEAVGGDEVVCAKSGSVAIERFTGPQIRKFYKTEPDSYGETARIHLVSSFLCSVLTGVDAAIDTGDGAGMNLLNIQSWEWDDELLDATAPDLLEKLPEVKFGESVEGEVSDYFIQRYGFSEGVEVTIFTGDNPSSLVGMGASEPGKVVISLGTSDTFFAAMKDVVSDPDGCGHVFGNPVAGSMSLQCFANGSLAREAVKDRFGYGWDEFTKAFSATECGNDGNLMLPFFVPETSPRLDLAEPILEGSEAFEAWENADMAIRACVEGQFLNMRQRVKWMGLSTDVIYLTGGASKNDAIAQVVSNIFQTKVERLTVSSSVALGAAMRAASNSLGKVIADLEKVFCLPDENGKIHPNVSESVYAESARRINELISKNS